MIYIPEGRRDHVETDSRVMLYHGKSIEHLTRFEDRNKVWPAQANG